MPDTVTRALDLQDPNKFRSFTAYRSAIAATQQARQDQIEKILTSSHSEGRRALMASEKRSYDDAMNELTALGKLADGAAIDYSAIPDLRTDEQRAVADEILHGTGSSVYRDGAPLESRQSMSGFVRNRGLIPEGEEHLSLGKYVRGLVLGEWKDAAAEKRAMVEGSPSSGGYLLPTILSAQIIDLARNSTQVLNAGARLFPMANRLVNVPRWLSDPLPAWHTESATISPSDASVGLMTLNAKTLAGITQISRELLEDAEDIDAELTRAFGMQMALAVDEAALYGTGTAPMPLGVKNTPGITTASMGTNGAALASYDTLVDAVGTLRDANESPNAVIFSPRTGREFAKLKDTQQRTLTPPVYLNGLPLLESNQVPNTLTQGTATTASDIFVGDWSQLYVGVRTQLQFTVLNERYADTGQVGIVAWWRGDIAVARPKSFSVTSGVL
jgi:HK97 family phage major capsid protein